MNRWCIERLGQVIIAGTLWILMPACVGAEEKYDAVITCGNGAKTFVQDLRVVYSWREMPANAKGLTSYQLRSKVEQGLWVPKRSSSTPSYEMIPFKDLESIEFNSVIKQLGVSDTYQFQVEEIWLKRLDGKRSGFAMELLSERNPVLWPNCNGLAFPGDVADKRIDHFDVMLQGKTKIEGRDSEYVFVFPPPVDTAIQPFLQKKWNAFVRLIQLSRPDSSK